MRLLGCEISVMKRKMTRRKKVDILVIAMLRVKEKGRNEKQIEKDLLALVGKDYQSCFLLLAQSRSWYLVKFLVQI